MGVEFFQGKKIISIDAETDGLYGEILSIGVAYSDEKIERSEHLILKDVATGKYNYRDKWAKENVGKQAVLAYNMMQTSGGKSALLFNNRKILLNYFWNELWMPFRETHLCLVDFGIPVEARLFRDCIMINQAERSFKGPYPAYDLGTILAMEKLDPDINRFDFVGMGRHCQHDPRWDAVAQLAVLFKLIKGPLV